jgi:excisionase family DNA binding protein
MATEDLRQLNLFGDAAGELLTAEQLADLLQMRRSTIEDYARRGLLPSLKLGRHRRFVRSDVLDALDELRRQAR